MAIEIAGHSKAELIVGLAGRRRRLYHLMGVKNMAPLPVVRRNTIPIVYDRFAVVSDMIRADVVWFNLVNAAIAGWAAVMLWQALLSVPDYYEMSPAERALWREFDSAVLVRTCDDGTDIYQMPNGEFVNDSLETIEDPATGCN
jgi:hypothetical protein